MRTNCCATVSFSEPKNLIPFIDFCQVKPDNAFT